MPEKTKDEADLWVKTNDQPPSQSWYSQDLPSVTLCFRGDWKIPAANKKEDSHHAGLAGATPVIVDANQWPPTSQRG